MTRKLAVVAACLVVAGCGGGPGGSGDSKSYADAQAVAKAAGCDTAKTSDEPMMIAVETVDCDVDGEGVAINWFDNNKRRDAYLDFGGDTGVPYVVGDKWVIECQSAAVRDRLAKATGGKAKDA